MKNSKNQQGNSPTESTDKSSNNIDTSLSMNVEIIKKRTGNSSDIVIRPVKLGKFPKVKTKIVYIKGLIDNQTVNDFLIEAMIDIPASQEQNTQQEVIDMIDEDVVAVVEIKKSRDWDELFTELMSGNTIIFIEGNNAALSVSTQGGEKRSIQESTTNVSIRGSKEAFNESIETNIALVRRIINTHVVKRLLLPKRLVKSLYLPWFCPI